MDINKWVFAMSIVDVANEERTQIREYQTRPKAETTAYKKNWTKNGEVI